MSENINTSTGFEIGAAKPVDERFIFQTLEERDRYNPNLLYQGLMCYVISEKRYYSYTGEHTWEPTVGNGGIHVSDLPPENENFVWVNNKDEAFVDWGNDEVLNEIRSVMQKLSKKVNKLENNFNTVIDPGFFPEPEKEPPSRRDMFEDMPPLPPNSNLHPNDEPTGELPENSFIIPKEELEPNANHILIKRGYKANLPILQDGEFGYCKDTKELYIGANGQLVLVNGKKDGGDNVTVNYIELLSPSKKVFRLTVSDEGALQIENMEDYNRPDPKPEDANLFAGLIINHVYGGGYQDTNNTPVSHGFIELYNTTENTMYLKGLSVHYGEYGKGWKTLNLFGKIPAKTSFLIRGAQHTAPDNPNVRLVVKDYDMEWNIPFTDMGMKVYLSVGKTSPRSLNPWASTGDTSNPKKELGYIDLVGVNAQDATLMVDGYEKAAPHLLSRTTSARRNDFNDTDANSKDLVAMDFSTCSEEDLVTYRPRGLKDGRWDVYFDKTKVDPNKPNLVTLGFGQDASKTRTFLWHSVRSLQDGFVMYKKEGAPDWTKVKASKVPVQYPDVDVYKWTAIITDLQPGNYTYKVGEEGKWSEEYHFTVKSHADNESFTFVQVSDQQGWNWKEYEVWQKAARFILDNETFDWVLNTGDYSQNGDRGFEWRDYHKGAYDMHCNFPLMGTIGNNDLVRKVESWAYTYYCNTENNAVVDGKEIVSCNCWEIGDTWFCCLNSNEDIEAQKKWFIEEIKKTTKKWKIVYTHDAPYTISKWQDDKDKSKGMYRNDSKIFYHFARLFESYGVHLVLCGHKHAYMRSGPIYNTYAVNDAVNNTKNRHNEPEREGGLPEGAFLHLTEPNPDDPERPYLDSQKGVYYLMSNATGFKLISNKDIAKPDWYYSEGHGFQFTDTKQLWPQYTVWTVTPEKIIGKSYKLVNIKSPNSNDNQGRIYKSCFDEFEIPYLNKAYRDTAYRGQIIVDQETGNISDNQTFVFTVRLSIAPTHDQQVVFSTNNESIAIESLVEKGVEPLADHTLTFTPLDYHKPRSIVVSKVNGDADSTEITLSSPDDPEIATQVTNKTVTISIS